jgi:hypothetical protein
MNGSEWKEIERNGKLNFTLAATAPYGTGDYTAPRSFQSLWLCVEGIGMGVQLRNGHDGGGAFPDAMMFVPFRSPHQNAVSMRCGRVCFHT